MEKEAYGQRAGDRSGLDPESLAIAALSFLAEDEARLERFLALSGLTPASLRDAAAAPTFLPAVLDYVASDDALLVAFAATQGCDPQSIARARARLAPASDQMEPNAS